MTEEARLFQRFTSKIRKDESGCWIWTACIANGYGKFEVKRPDGVWRPVWAHRFLYLKLNGPLRRGLELDHLCRNTKCVNPDHLEPVTHKENMARSERGTRTHCRNGHRYDHENTQIRLRAGSRSRHCRECIRVNQRSRRAAARGAT